MSKGSRQRTLNTSKFNSNFDSIFKGDSNERDTSIPLKKEEECAVTKAEHNGRKRATL